MIAIVETTKPKKALCNVQRTEIKFLICSSVKLISFSLFLITKNEIVKTMA